MSGGRAPAYILAAISRKRRIERNESFHKLVLEKGDRAIEHLSEYGGSWITLKTAEGAFRVFSIIGTWSDLDGMKRVEDAYRDLLGRIISLPGQDVETIEWAFLRSMSIERRKKFGRRLL